MRIEPFHSRDLGELVGVWNRNLPADPVSPARLEARVLLDPNFRETFALLAREEAQIAGFVLGICGEGFCYQARQVPPEEMGSRAWILALEPISSGGTCSAWWRNPSPQIPSAKPTMRASFRATRK